jgi:alkylated DNA repair protein alkB family protein 6
MNEQLTTDETSADASSSSGRTIAAVPLARIYLAPRSLLIMSSSLYTTHLHGISPITEDIITSNTHTTRQAGDAAEVEYTQESRVPVVNLDMLPSEIQDAVRDKGEFRSERGKRTSLTFRRVTRVMRGGGLACKVFGAR